jgi:hypothetical protein
MSRELSPSEAEFFANELRDAREAAQKDAEDFDQIIHSVELLGSFLFGRVDSLSGYQNLICNEARNSPLADDVPTQCPEFHVPVERLYELVKDARDDAMHQGAFARRLTEHSIQLSLILEDALRKGHKMSTVGEYMSRKPIFAELWQPISFLRQIMLENAFSYLPVKMEGGCYLVADLDIASYLGRATSKTDRKRRLATRLLDALSEKLVYARRCTAETSVEQALKAFDEDHRPLLIWRAESDPPEIIGILSPSDLL